MSVSSPGSGGIRSASRVLSDAAAVHATTFELVPRSSHSHRTFDDNWNTSNILRSSRLSPARADTADTADTETTLSINIIETCCELASVTYPLNIPKGHLKQNYNELKITFQIVITFVEQQFTTGQFWTLCVAQYLVIIFKSRRRQSVNQFERRCLIVAAFGTTLLRGG